MLQLANVANSQFIALGKFLVLKIENFATLHLIN